jgi:hypothetical protein
MTLEEAKTRIEALEERLQKLITIVATADGMLLDSDHEWLEAMAPGASDRWAREMNAAEGIAEVGEQ